MLNYELGVGFSGINWAFAGLLFFLIISVMFRYLKKNTICGDALITIHAGIVFMSFVMFFPVCVILSSIKYGGTNVFAHMSGYLFGWLTFPLLAFLLEVSERRNPPGVTSHPDIPGTSGLLRIRKQKDTISAISVNYLLRFRSLTEIKDPLIIRSRFVKLHTGGTAPGTGNVRKPVHNRLLLLTKYIHRQTRRGLMPIRTDTACITEKTHKVSRFSQTFSFIARKKGIADQECSDPVPEDIPTEKRVHPWITRFSLKRHHHEPAGSPPGEGFKNKRAFMGFSHKKRENLLLPHGKNHICTRISRQSLSNHYPRVSALFYRMRRVLTQPFLGKKNPSGKGFTGTMPDNSNESNGKSHDNPVHVSEPELSQPDMVSSLPVNRTRPRDWYSFTCISFKNLICAPVKKVCQCTSHIFSRFKGIPVFLSPIVFRRKPKKAEYTISLLDELSNSSGTGNSVFRPDRTRYSLLHPVQKIPSTARHMMGTIQKSVHNRPLRRKKERLTGMVSLFETESVECSHAKWKKRLKNISFIHRIGNNRSEKLDKYQK